MATAARGMSSRAAQAEQTRQQILQTSQRLFAEHGYDATSIQMIADEMGLTKAAVYYHFRAKSDILHAALRPGIQRAATLMDEAALLRGKRSRMEHVVNGVVEFLVQNRHYAVMASRDPAAKRHSPDAEADWMDLRRRGITLFYGEHPTGAERLSYNAMLSVPDSLSDLVDLTDEELREALQTTMLRILRVPSRG